VEELRARPRRRVEPGGRGCGRLGYARRLAGKYGTTEAEAAKMLASMTGAAALEGLDFRFDRAVPANTFEAHQLVHLAAQQGRQDEMKERLLRAYFTEGAAVG
jgi:predicted DsbA family dithiol-disulfide isomerase